MTTRFAPLAPGDPRQAGGYALRARLGAGGMGRVYLAFTPGGRPLAIKVIRPEHAENEEFRRRFEREVAAAQRVQGLYTAPVVDAGPTAPLPWLATVYVPGPSLRQAVAEHGPLPLPTVFRLLAGVAEGLAAIHACGIFHRDLTPANVLLAEDGPRVIDFGIAHAAAATSLTSVGLRVGTPAFMAPEQARGRPASPATDVFGLGHLAVFAATGRPAFGEGNMEALFYRIVNEAPDLTGCPSPLRAIAERCLAKDPGQRPGLAEVMNHAREQTRGQTMELTRSWLPPHVTATLNAYDTAQYTVAWSGGAQPMGGHPGPGPHPGSAGGYPGPGPQPGSPAPPLYPGFPWPPRQGQHPGPGAQPLQPPGQPYSAPPYAGQQPGSPARRDPSLAGTWRRLLGRLIDEFALTLLTLPIWVPAIRGAVHHMQVIAQRYPAGLAQPAARAAFDQAILAFYGTLFLLAAAQAVISFGYDWLQHGVWGRTLGKRALGTKVVMARDRSRITGGAAAGRAAVYGLIPAVPFIGGLFALLNELWLLWDPHRQCLHDKAAGTVVVKARFPPGTAPPSW